MLFSGTVADNVALGRAGATQQAVEAACRVAGAHGFVLALPGGYTARCGGAAGALLSGGYTYSQRYGGGTPKPTPQRGG